MDARPYRPVRPVPGMGNENVVPGAKQTIHQHHKSTGSLLNMASNGNLKVAGAKRGALADSSNVKSLLPLAATGAAAKKVGSIDVSTAVAKAQENHGEQIKPKDALLRPAQRSKAVSSIAQPASIAQGRPLSSESQPLRGSKQNWPLRRPAKAMVYNDAQPEKQRPASEVLNTAATKKTIRASTSSSQADPISRQPRHYQSQPVLKPNQAAPRNQPSKPKNAAISQGDCSVSYAPEKPEQGDIVDLTADTSDLDSDPSETAKPANSQDDDVTEAPYLDAIENLPGEDVYPVLAPTHLSTNHSASLPEPIMPVKTTVKTEVKAVDFLPPHIPSAPADEHVELSDGEDYYDDQGYTTAHSNRGDYTTGATTIILPPRITNRDATELEDAKLIVESNRSPQEEEEEAWDVSMVAEYGDEIFEYMRQLELSMLPHAHYMEIQTEIQWSMRSVLMDWVIQVHTRFGLLPETLFLTVNYIDRFLSQKIVSLGKLQLVGATAIFVAAKYEEINCPSVQEIVYMVDGGYSIDEILKAERFMLSMLNFELGWPGPMSFLRRISKADDYDLESRTLSKYFLEVTIMDERFVASTPSHIAAGAHCLSRLILEKGGWTPAHVHYSGYTFSQLKPLVGMILDCCRIARKHHNAVFEKYADRRYKRVSTFVEGQIKAGFRLPFQPTLTQPLSCGYWEEDATCGYQTSTQALRMPLPYEG